MTKGLLHGSTYHITVSLKHQIEGALLVDYGGKAPIWVPSNSVEMAASDEGAGLWLLTMPIWMAEERGLYQITENN